MTAFFFAAQAACLSLCGGNCAAQRVHFGIWAAFMPAVFEVRLLVAVGYREYNAIFKGWR